MLRRLLRRAAGDERMVVLLNFSNETVDYDAAAVEGLERVLSSVDGAPEAGTLRPLEAVIWH